MPGPRLVPCCLCQRHQTRTVIAPHPTPPHLPGRQILLDLEGLGGGVVLDVLLGVDADEVQPFGEGDGEEVRPHFGAGHEHQLWLCVFLGGGGLGGWGLLLSIDRTSPTNPKAFIHRLIDRSIHGYIDTHASINASQRATLSRMGSSSGMIRLKAARKMYGSGSVCAVLVWVWFV